MDCKFTGLRIVSKWIGLTSFGINFKSYRRIVSESIGLTRIGISIRNDILTKSPQSEGPHFVRHRFEKIKKKANKLEKFQT